jgi:citrate lyase subunit alpha / citrate CoA-transferase
MDKYISYKIVTENKLINSIEELLNKIILKDGMTVSFHHHLRNGDHVLNMVLKALAKRGIKGITVAVSSIFPVHAPMVEYIKDETVTGIVTSYMSGPVAEAVSYGYLKNPAIMQTHGGRARAIESGELHIDVAFIAAPTADTFGNINGVHGKSACGALGYAAADAEYADVVVAITDNLVDYPACPIEISEANVDYVVKVDSIGDAAGIVSGTTKITKEPVGLIIAKTTAKVIEASGLIKNGMSFQTGAGGISLAVAAELRKIMIKKEVKGSFASGGITEYLVNMLDEGLFENLFDVQCFDLKAVESYRDNPKHQPMTASQYGNPNKKGCVSDKLDVMILGASEMDLDFNVNVTTGSDGVIMGGSGGHSDTAAGAKLSIVVTNLIKARLPIIKDRVTTITTPGESIDVVVTERGIAVNPLRKDLETKLKSACINVLSINELKNIAEKMTGKPKLIKTGPKVVAVVEYRDGSIIDKVFQVNG